jgi:hypothetical protein
LIGYNIGYNQETKMSDKNVDSTHEENTVGEAGGLDDAVKAKAVDGRISCAALRKIAEEFGVHYRKAGESANTLGIKIKSCDLGCF